MKPKAIQTIEDYNGVLFKVQTTWPDESRPENANKFSGIVATAFVHFDTVRDAGATCRISDSKYAIWTHRKMFRDNTVEVPAKYDGYVTDALHFKLASDAFRVAKFIAEECRLFSGYSNGMAWQTNYRGKIKTRVVMESIRKTVHEVKESV